MAKSSEKVREYIIANPDVPAAQVAKKFRITPGYVYVLRSAIKKQNQKIGTRAAERLLAGAREVEKLIAKKEKADMVNRPPHYTAGGIEVIDYIEAKGLDYNLGNVVKYISRAGKKGDGLEDLRKARWYLDRAIEKHGV